ncbi:MAG: sugar isomerase [Ruminococcaceae bacterium]|nr:sugar isomerase [Oscillospiraceae bacterium]
MSDKRSRNAQLNIITSLAFEIITLLCGLLIPRFMIGAFGSEVYGATASIAQFLAYIALLEGGIGGVARAALYRPLADGDTHKLSMLTVEIKKFFYKIAYVFGAYVIVLACVFKRMSDLEALDWISTAALVIVISISTFAQYFIGISNSILLQAAQKSYVTNIVSLAGTILNTAMVLLLIRFDCGIITVKLVSSCVFALKPIAMWMYVRKHYKLTKCEISEPQLKQKTTALGQHLAYFLHSNMDIVLLTWLSDLASVAVYTVYNMVVSGIQKLTASFTSGMEALFGDMLAKNEKDGLNKTFGYYETLISTVSGILFSITAVMIVPFVKIYTDGIDDADYIAPLFAILLVVSALLYSLRMPYHAAVMAAGHFKQTRFAAYGEAIINLILSILLIKSFNLVGVIIGTIVATLYRFIYYVIYLSKNILNRNALLFAKRIAVNSSAFAVSFLLGRIISQCFEINNFGIWIMVAICVAVVISLTTLLINGLAYHKDYKDFFGILTKKIKHGRKP